MHTHTDLHSYAQIWYKQEAPKWTDSRKGGKIEIGAMGEKEKRGNGERKKRIWGRKYSGLERKYISIICTQISSATKLICCYLLIPNSYDKDFLKNFSRYWSFQASENNELKKHIITEHSESTDVLKRSDSKISIHSWIRYLRSSRSDEGGGGGVFGHKLRTCSHDLLICVLILVKLWLRCTT